MKLFLISQDENRGYDTYDSQLLQHQMKMLRERCIRMEIC